MMIQKFRWINERDITTTENQISLQRKINELVDAVNGILDYAPLEMAMKAEPNQKERTRTKIAILEQNNQVLQNKCEEYLGELQRTRKALDVARHTIGWINQMIDGHADKQAIKIKCEYALEQITALEQKD